MEFSSSQLAEIYDGRWENLSEEVNFTGVSYRLNHAKAGDLFVIRSKEDFSEIKQANFSEVKAALAQGVRGFLVSSDFRVEGAPCYVVDNTKYAFFELARYNRRQTQATRVLVTGSYGKTGFKSRLTHLIQDSISVSSLPGASNQDAAVCRSLCDIKPEHKVSVIEVSASRPHRTRRRGRVIKANITVITSLGHEHIHRHGSLDNLIQQKTSFARYMGEQGICLIPKDAFYLQTCAALTAHNPDVRVLSFGDDPSCDAYVLHQEFVDFGWNVQASIQGIKVSFRVPLVEIFAVTAALAELLCAHLLGVEIFKAAARYSSVINKSSSGGVFKVNARGKQFYLYDHSRRGGVENYERFFETLAYIQPPQDARKLLLTSAFMDHKDGDLQYVKAENFQQRIENARIDELYTVEYFSEHLEVLRDKSIWAKHRFKCEEIFDDFFAAIRSGDFVCVKGIFESKLHKFNNYLLKQCDAEIQPINRQLN
ncbi:Mur ligase family protein [Oceanospirillum beijerinckii]|uniref:Mur ligase family protein n=1 Tax=Oceanospirillum beijerinckii TaxID=64976 RepID=UPI0004140A77|nr:Mur ligase family protein [Oceanospirillum beijerinckii]